MRLLICMGLAAWKQAASIYSLQPAPRRQRTAPAHSLDGVSEPRAGAGGGQPPPTHLSLIPLSTGQGKSTATPPPPSQLSLPGQQPHGTSSPGGAEPEQVMEGGKGSASLIPATGSGTGFPHQPAFFHT